MNGPLLINLLPPEQIGEAAKASQVLASCAVAILLLAGILFSLLIGLKK